MAAPSIGPSSQASLRRELDGLLQDYKQHKLKAEKLVQQNSLSGGANQKQFWLGWIKGADFVAEKVLKLPIGQAADASSAPTHRGPPQEESETVAGKP